jgi:hypothetical protein
MVGYQFHLKLINSSTYNECQKQCKHPSLRVNLINLFHLGFTLPSCQSSASAIKLFYLPTVHLMVMFSYPRHVCYHASCQTDHATMTPLSKKFSLLRYIRQ